MSDYPNLQPFGDSVHQWAKQLKDLDDGQLDALIEETYSVRSNETPWPVYHAAPIVKALAERERRWRRVVAS